MKQAMLHLLATFERQGIYCEVMLMLFSWNFILHFIKYNTPRWI